MATQTADDDKKRIAAFLATLGAGAGGTQPGVADSSGFDLNSLVNNAASQGAGALLGAKAKQVEGEAGTRHITNVSSDVVDPFHSGFFQPAAQREAAMVDRTGAYAPTNLAARTATRRAQGTSAAPVGAVVPDTTLPGMSPQELVATETRFAPRVANAGYSHGLPMPVHGKVTSAGGQNEASNYLAGDDPDYGNSNYIGPGDLVPPSVAPLPSQLNAIGAAPTTPKQIPTAPPLPAASSVDSNLLLPGHTPIGDFGQNANKLMHNLGMWLIEQRKRGALGY